MAGNLRPKISLVVITKDEEPNIERCLKSVPWADDIVVLDSGSRDRTVEIATRMGARSFVEPWRGYRAQKQRAVELARYDWILSLDADEALSPELQREFLGFFGREATTFDTDADGFEFPRLSFHLGRWIRRGGWYPDHQLRLFHRGRAKWAGGDNVHERVEAQRVRRFQSPIHHWPFTDLSDQIDTNNNYSSLGARELHERGVRYSLLKLLLKPVSKFIETYLLKRGCLDGWAGFVIAVGAAYSVFLKFAKLRELESSRRQKR